MVQDIRTDIGRRLSAERERIGLSQLALADAIGASRRSVIGWESGDSMPSADMLAVIGGQGIDVGYVISGVRSQAVPEPKSELTDREVETLQFLQQRGVFPCDGNNRLSLEGLSLVLDYVLEAKRGRPIALTAKELERIARFTSSDPRPWVFQPLSLEPREDGPRTPVLLVYRVKTPVSRLFVLGPLESSKIPQTIEVTGWPSFPLKVNELADGNEEWWHLELDPAQHQALQLGNVIQASAM